MSDTPRTDNAAYVLNNEETAFNDVEVVSADVSRLLERELSIANNRSDFYLRETVRLSGVAAELRKDAERLDWIDAQRGAAFDHIGHGEYTFYVFGKGHPKVREVIDAAGSRHE